MAVVATNVENQAHPTHSIIQPCLLVCVALKVTSELPTPKAGPHVPTSKTAATNAEPHALGGGGEGQRCQPCEPTTSQELAGTILKLPQHPGDEGMHSAKTILKLSGSPKYMAAPSASEWTPNDMAHEKWPTTVVGPFSDEGYDGEGRPPHSNEPLRKHPFDPSPK